MARFKNFALYEIILSPRQQLYKPDTSLIRQGLIDENRCDCRRKLWRSPKALTICCLTNQASDKGIINFLDARFLEALRHDQLEPFPLTPTDFFTVRWSE